MFQHFQLLESEGRLKTVRESDEVWFAFNCRRTGYNSNGATRVNEGVARPTHLHERDDLCPREDVVGLVRH